MDAIQLEIRMLSILRNFAKWIAFMFYLQSDLQTAFHVAMITFFTDKLHWHIIATVYFLIVSRPVLKTSILKRHGFIIIMTNYICSVLFGYLHNFKIAVRILSIARLRAQFWNCVPSTQFGKRINYVFSAFWACIPAACICGTYSQP